MQLRGDLYGHLRSRKKKLEENPSDHPAPCLCNGIPKAITCKSEFSKEARCTSGTVKRSISPKSLEYWKLVSRGDGKLPPGVADKNSHVGPRFFLKGSYHSMQGKTSTLPKLPGHLVLLMGFFLDKFPKVPPKKAPLTD